MNKKMTLKIQMTSLILVICLLPIILNLFGIDFSSASTPLTEPSNTDAIFNSIAGALHHILLEWTAVIIAGMFTIVSFFHYRKSHDIAVPILGLALLSAGIVDSYHTLAAMRIIDAPTGDGNFIPFTWALSRVFNSSMLLLVAILIFVLAKFDTESHIKNKYINFRTLICLALSLITLTLYVVYQASVLNEFPVTQFPNALISRPYDVIPLALFICCAVFYWLLYRENDRIVRYILFLAIIPQLATQLHMAFGSSSLFDNHFNIAHFLKIIAYGVLLLGVLIDLFFEHYQYRNVQHAVEPNIEKSVKPFTDKAIYQVKKRKLLAYQLPLITFLLSAGMAAVVGFVLFYESEQVLKQQRLYQMKQNAQHIEDIIHRESADRAEQLNAILSSKRVAEFQSHLSNQTLQYVFSDNVDLGVMGQYLGESLYIFSLSKQDTNTLSLLVEHHRHNLALIPTNEVVPTLQGQLLSFKGEKLSTIIAINGQYYWLFVQSIQGAEQPFIVASIHEFQSTIDHITSLDFGLSNVLLMASDASIVDFNAVNFEGDITKISESNLATHLFSLDKSRENKTPESLNFSLEDVGYFGFHKAIDFGDTVADAHLVLFKKQTNALEAFAQIRSREIVIFISLIIIVLAMSIYYSQRLTNPLTSIVKSIQQYQQTGQVGHLPLDSHDEIGVLARSFANMLGEIEDKVKKTEIAYQGATEVSAKMQAILNSMVDAVINIDHKGTIVAFNHSAEKMFGYSEQEALGQNIQLLMPLSIANTHDHYLAEYFKTGNKNLLREGRELPAMRQDGEVFPMYLSLSEIDTNHGKIFTGVIRDITSTKLLEAESKQVLQSAKDLAWRLEFALSGPQIGVWDYDLSNKVLNWDSRMYELFGGELEEGETPDEICERVISAEEYDNIKLALKTSLANNRDFKIVISITMPNHLTKYVESHAKIFYDQEGKVKRLVGTSRDITEQYQLQELKQQALDMAEDSLRLKSEFLASMSHEIRTPMNGVIGMLGLLERDQLNKRQRHYVQLASSSASSLLHVINDILDFSKIEAGKLELEIVDFDLRRQLSEVIESQALKAQEKDLEVVLDVTGIKDSMIKGDPTRIRQIVSNLVSNAIKFTDHGEIVVRGALSQHSNNKLLFECSVIDSGIGIAQDKLSTLFDSFTQVDASTTRKYGGTGLGLAIVKQLCRLMDGSVSVSSEVNQGSVFDFTLVLEPSKNEEIIIPSVEIVGTEVLIVDDNETNLEVLEGQLSQWGAVVTKASSGPEAIQQVERHAINYFKVAILDMQMPGMDGAMLGKALKDSVYCCDTKFIMMTSMGAANDAKYFADLGFSAYFPKPATISDLFDALSIVLDSGEAMSAATPLLTRENLHTFKTNEESMHPTINSEARILLVEDNRVNQAVVLGILDSFGCRVDVANNGVEALDKLEKVANEDDAYDVVLMDCQMPMMDGYQATRAIRSGKHTQIGQNIPIIAMTANAMKGDKEKCLESGMDDYIAKPIDTDLLLEKLSTWVDTIVIKAAKDNMEERVEQQVAELTTKHSTEQDIERKNTQVEKEEIIWDQAGLIKRVRENKELAQKLINMFLDDAVASYDALIQAVDSASPNDVTAAAHKLKGSARNIGGVKLGKVTDQLEQAGKAGQTDVINELLPSFKLAYQELIATLEEKRL